jgi:hypothetical protein
MAPRCAAANRPRVALPHPPVDAADDARRQRAEAQPPDGGVDVQPRRRRLARRLLRRRLPPARPVGGVDARPRQLAPRPLQPMVDDDGARQRQQPPPRRQQPVAGVDE